MTGFTTWNKLRFQLTFALVRPHKYSAFELMHRCRKPRLPFEAENLAFLHPDVSMEENSLKDTVVTMNYYNS